jgi:multicomponent Na+:H+ antiporter subunit G
MTEWIAAFLIFSGSLFGLLAAIGIFRMPDLFTRMQASTKTGTLGLGCILTAVAVYFADLTVAATALLIVSFVFLTAPVAAHVLARAAYCAGVPLWRNSVRDDLAGRYDSRTHALESAPEREESGE